MGHPLFKTKCSKCNHLVHETVICQNKIQHDEGAQTVDQEEGEEWQLGVSFRCYRWFMNREEEAARC